MDDTGADIRATAQRPLSFLQTVKAVAWSFVGLRKRAGYEQDVQKLNPVHVVLARVIGAGLFVLALGLAVNWVVHSGVAAG